MQTESCAAHVSPGSAEGIPSQEGAPRVGGTPRPAGRRPGRPEPVVSLSSRPWLLLAAAVDQTASCPARAVAVCGTAALLSLPSPRLKGIDTCVHGDAGVTLPYDEGPSPQATQGPSGEPRSRSPQSGDIYHPRLPNLPFPRALPWDPNTQTHGAWPPSSTGRPRGPAPSCPPGQDPAAPACPTPPCCLRLPATWAGHGLHLFWPLQQRCGSFARHTTQDVLSMRLPTCYGPFPPLRPLTLDGGGHVPFRYTPGTMPRTDVS